MNGMLKTRGKRVLCAVTMLVMVLVMAAPAAVYAADNPLNLTVEQVFHTSSDLADATFTYILKPLEAGNPMPAGSTAAGYTFTIASSNSIQIGPLSYSRQGVFRYEVYQVIDTEKPNYTYDKRVYTVEMYVDGDLKVEIVVLNQDGTKADNIEFENGYYVSASDPELMTDPPVKKTVSGNPSKASEFTFALVAGNPLNPMPAGSVDGVKTITIVGSGEAEFGTWSYSKAGTYYYTVYEVNVGESGYTYDTAVYTFTDTVREENGQFVLSRVVTNDLNKQVSTLTFINKYTSGSGSGSGGTGPKTGDDSNNTFYIVLLVLGGVLVIGATLYLVAGKKHKGTPTS